MYSESEYPKSSRLRMTLFSIYRSDAMPPGSPALKKPNSLVEPLFEGPIDIVGDVHGEIEALRDLLGHLDYGDDGLHVKGRRLVFVGDLTDRGPDSPAVIDLVKRFVESGRAQCVLGNHELNLLLCADTGKRKFDNHWFFGEERSLDGSDQPTPAVLADDEIRQSAVDFFKTLPLALQRDDLRVVHACWDDSMIRIAREASDAVALHERYRDLIAVDHELHPELDTVDRRLAHQNRNPVKVLTSGKERRVATPFEASGKLRYEERVPWWDDYGADEPVCVCGHYAIPAAHSLLPPQVHCVDYGVAKRWRERQQPDLDGSFELRLAAARFPERVVICDNGSSASLFSEGP